MKILAEAKYEGEKLDEDNMPVIKTDQVYLLHWGTTYQVVETKDGVVPANYTVAICQDVKSGQIRTFLPEQLRILGEDISKLKTPKK